MRISKASWLLAAATRTIASASSAAQVFLYDSGSLPTTPESVDPATARLILAQRLDLSQFHSLSNSDEEAIRQINTFGGSGQALFTGDSEKVKGSVMMVVEGIKEPLIPALTEFSSFSVSPAPHPSDTLQLFSTFSSEAAQIPHTTGPDASTLRILAPLSDLKENSLNSYNNRRTLLHIKSIASAPKSDITEQLQTLSSVVTKLHALAQEGEISFSILFTPPSHHCSKRSTNAYGILKSRTTERLESEKFLSEQAPPPVAVAKPSSTSTSSMIVKPTRSLLLSGPIPTCFASQSLCESKTNNCSAHGTCIRKWKGVRDAGDCYGCACSIPEVRTNKDGGKKTTHYGGAACHKKDVVTPFWLLSGTTVFLILIVAWGIGLLYSMGGQELPSVIGAGVSGPTRK